MFKILAPLCKFDSLLLEITIKSHLKPPQCADPDSFISSTGDDPPADGKILFKKPAKRSSEDKFQGITASSSKKKKSDRGEKTQDEQKEVKSGKKIKNKSLLSFGGDDEEEED